MFEKAFNGRFLLTVLFHVVCYTLTPCATLEPPKFVFRSDFRPPTEIFQNGFKHLGDNENLVDHVSGESCQFGSKKDTAFIATSACEATARKLGIRLLWSTGLNQPNIYVYKIRATQNFYDAQLSLKKAYKATLNHVFLDMAEKFRLEKEWLAYKEIPKEQVMSAVVYKRGFKLGYGEIQRTDFNRLYVESNNTKANPNPYPVKGKRLGKGVSLITTNTDEPISACFASCPSGECKMAQSIYKTCPNERKGTYWDPVSKGLKEGLLPWNEIAETKGLHAFERPDHCTIDTGNPTDPSPELKIDCPQNRFYERFAVYLKGGTGSDTLFKHESLGGRAGRTWTKSATQIHMLDGKGNLADKGYEVPEVFTGSYGIWWSEISVYPIYPKIKY